MTIWYHLKQAFFPWRAERSRERRSERRHPVTWESILMVDGQLIEAALIDSSVRGTRLRSQRKLVAGQQVSVSFPSGPRLAVCRWSRCDGREWLSGLQFTVQAVEVPEGGSGGGLLGRAGCFLFGG